MLHCSDIGILVDQWVNHVIVDSVSNQYGEFSGLVSDILRYVKYSVLLPILQWLTVNNLLTLGVMGMVVRYIVYMCTVY